MFTGIVHDITERKRAEDELARHGDRLEDLIAERTAALEASHEQLRLSERLASIGTLAAGLGHDMNNVLFPVRCQLDALESATLPEAIRQELSTVRQSLQYLQQLSDGLRLLALDPDDPNLAPGVTNLTTWWSEARPLFVTVLGSRVTLQGSFDSGLPPVAVAPHRLTQAIFNLVTNAAEAISQQGTVVIRATALDDRRFVRLAVEDDGCGMSPEVKRRALDPFFTSKKRSLSTGLGLSLVHGVAKSAGGMVEIESTLGEGTTVAVTLPAAEAWQSATVHGPQIDRRATVSLRDRRAATFVSALLETVGYDVRYENAGEPGDVRLWVTDATPAHLGIARGFLGASSGRHVIAFGEREDRWEEIGAAVVNATEGMEAIRQAIRTVVAAEAARL